MNDVSSTAPCDKCYANCCRYIAIEIDKPKTKTEYDHIRWYLYHDNVNVFVDHDKKWHVEFKTDCEMIDNDNSCIIYNNRPKICKNHGNEDNECEYYDSPYYKYFSDVKQFERYLNKKNINWKFKNI